MDAGFHLIGSNSKKHFDLKQIIRILGNIVFAVLLVIVLLIFFLIIQGKLSGDIPSIFGYRLYVVLTGSMDPSIPAGSLAVVEKSDADQLALRDVITYRDFDSGKLITHRIVGINNKDGQLQFTTRGDANDTDDFNPVKATDIVGQVRFSIPLIGSLMEFARSKTGLLVFLIIPGVIIVIYELRKLFRYAVVLDRNKESESQASAESTDADSPPEEPEGH